MNNLKFRRIVSLCLAISMLFVSLSGCKSNVPDGPIDLSAYLVKVGENNTNGIISYANYIKQFEKNSNTAETQIQLVGETTESPVGSVIQVPFSVEKAGLYRLCAEITGGKESLSDYYGSVIIDGELPFYESEQVYFPKNWISKGDFDNSKQPELSENTNYISLAHSDKSYEAAELYFYLEAGQHTFDFAPSNQAIEVNSLYFEGYEPALNKESNPKNTNAESVLVQAENPASRSKSSILEQIDRTSAATMPVCLDRATYNTLGGSSWSKLGESVSWEFDVKTAGWYCLNLRVRQDYSAGAVSCRRLLVDGKVLTDSTAEITIPYDSAWQGFTVSDEEGEPYWIYFDAGTHTVTLSSSLGSLSEVVPIVQNSVSECNLIYRRIIMITGTDPDPYRDYNLDDKLPDVFKSIEEQTETLTAVADYLSQLGEGGESDAAVFRKLIRQFEEFLENSDTIPDQISTFSSNISAIGTWLLECSQQPLEIDWLELQAYGSEDAQSIKTGGFKQLGHTVTRIVKSYTESYDDMNNVDAEKTINVWAVTGRDQMQIIENLTTEDFTKKTSIGVNLKLVSGDSIMAATVAGLGPDVTLFNGPPTVISYAIRKAVRNLSDLEGFDETLTDFHESAIVPYRFNGGVYALPETQSFPMLFYRQDILDELQIEIPTTWEDVYDCITTLQKNNMTFGCPVYDVFLYQNGGSYYNENGSKSYMDTEQSIAAFRQWTKFYTNFNLPLTYNFINRFRSGEMPMAIADYSSYNSLVIFAPEISGSWGMTMVPGTVDKNGDVNYSVSAGGTAAMIFTSTEDVDSSWKFLKWWVSGETQSDYALSLETKLGTSARVMVASKSAFDTLDWTAEQGAALKQQWEWVVGTPEVPGGYLMTRHVNNAFRKIVYDDADLRETLGEYTVIIDKELTLKRQEYGLE